MALAIPLLAGCAAGGAKFSTVDSIPEQKALVYIYRPNSFVGGAIKYHVAVGDKRIVYLVRGGYFPFLAEPGETEFWARTEARAAATEYLAPGETYYLRGKVGIGVVAGRPKLQFVSAEEARGELEKCKLLPAATP
jgi:hypothetical protein